jgi:cobalamin biosynthetic protein CobC
VQDHGGDLGTAIARFGGRAEDWIDLSTGINRQPYPLPPPPPGALRDLPRREDGDACARAALAAYGAAPAAACLPLAGAQAAIRLLPALRPPGRAAILGPTYNEHAAAFAAAGWQVTEALDPAALRGFDAVVVVNPNNPDGRALPPAALLALAGRNGLLIVDESFADVAPAVSICPDLGRPGTLVLRSFGKFHGLAGLRLGFVLGAGEDIARLRELAGPWPVSGPALAAGVAALPDRAWAEATRARLAADAERLDRLALAAGWRLVGGTPLFRLYDTPGARAARERLARGRVWSRFVPYCSRWIRLGLPGPEPEWNALSQALAAGRHRRRSR